MSTLIAVVSAVGLISTACSGSGPDGGGTRQAAKQDECREIAHATGTACVPNSPERIVVLDALMALPTLLELDAPVVAAAAVYGAGEPFPSYFDPEQTEGIALAGDMQKPNMEVILEIAPDLIIAPEPMAEEIGDQLARIAPLVVTRFSSYEPGWRDDVRLVGEAVGRSAEVDASLVELDDHIAEARAHIEQEWGSPTLTRIDIFRGSPVYYRAGCTWFGAVLAEAGVGQPEEQGPDDCEAGNYESALVYPSLEELDILEADAIVAYQQQAAEAEVGADALAALSGSPVWNDLSAVQDDRVFVLGDAWGVGGSITSAHLMLDDLTGVVFPAKGSA